MYSDFSLMDALDGHLEFASGRFPVGVSSNRPIQCVLYSIKHGRVV